MPNNYTEERTIPKVPICRKSQIALVFDGSFMRAIGTKTTLVFPAVSGTRDAKGKFDYSAERQKIPYKGPIPAGEYWVQPSQIWANNWFKSLVRTPRSVWGNFRLTIHPYPGTQTHGRGGFLFMVVLPQEMLAALTSR